MIRGDVDTGSLRVRSTHCRREDCSRQCRPEPPLPAVPLASVCAAIRWHRRMQTMPPAYSPRPGT
ncbi:MAG: hypothetical protein ACNI3A_11140 [Desulfovibrio sp.]|uniref:hypothetical protein n=1 Tax=Desulfovibrio sp. 7SRBS1 TaxID=3378064 RepID=UPI003B3DD42D